MLRAPPGETNAVRSSHAFRADGTLLLETIPVDEYRHDTPDRRTRLRQVWAKDADWWSEYQDYRDGVLQTSARLKQFIPAPAEKVEARTE